MHYIVINDLCILVYKEFHASIGIYKSLNGKKTYVYIYN
jgi:hypothetical protein